ncbi:hypothetical protein [uncultured Tenacibaculum sp.]|uniref:hypothetical protein n=1 Tax=uncultured Tenacibaculum sp. TaxID=174713 RepID=UPI002618DCB9|nr:hypothetical protein [uncultured Tenacibaculum sp.]
MSLKFDLSGLTQKKIKLTENDNPASMILTNVSPEAKIKVDYRKKNGQTVTYINNLSVGLVLESQKKIEALSSSRVPFNHPRTGKIAFLDIPVTARSYETHMHTTGQMSPEALALKSAIISLGVNGEINLEKGDDLTITISNLKKHDNSFVEFKGGRSVATGFYTFTNSVWEKKDDRLNVDLSNVQFLAFKPQDIPDQINFIINGQLIEHTSDNLKAFSVDRFGITSVQSYFNEGVTEVKNITYGVGNVLLLDVRGASSVVLEKDGRTTDLDYYTLNFK